MNVHEYSNLQCIKDFHFGFAKFEIRMEDGHTRMGIINEKEEVVLAPEYIFIHRLDEYGRYQVKRPDEEMQEILL